jgi:dihydrofolate reductase
MRRVRYQVAMSLDGYIAGPKGQADWIIMDPEIDFAALFDQFDAFLVGRHTYETARSMFRMPGKEIFVFSRTLRQEDCPGVTVVAQDEAGLVASLRAKPGKDIWLFGGGDLFRSLLGAGLVDTVELAVIPVLLGEGIPVLAPPAEKANLKLTGHKVYKSGIVLLEYAIDRAVAS